MGYEPLTPPDKQQEIEENKTPFFMTATLTDMDGEFVLSFKTGENIFVSKAQMIEMINQLSLGLMLGD
jgi:hypothetical protein